jgi:hypothetical protein
VGGRATLDPVWEVEPHLVWEKELLPSNGGWNTSLAKKEC